MTAWAVGRLLVATPKLTDPNFARTVVYVVAHDEDGAFGIVLNRPLERPPLAEVLPLWAGHAALPVAVFKGGPVEPAMALGLARRDSSAAMPGWTPVGCGAGLVDLAMTPDEPGLALVTVRIFTGYAGWGAGQLEGEIAESAWFVIDGKPADLFTADPDRLFHDVLRRQPGHLAMFAHYPPDPTAN